MGVANAHTLLELSVLVHAIKTTVDLLNVLNWSSKSSGDTAQMICSDSSELSLLAHAVKTKVDCMSTSTKCTYV